MSNILKFTEDEEREIRAMQEQFPYRIIYTARKGDEFITSAVTSMRIPKQLARDGWTVNIIK